jgi:transcriptional regulator with XRE-family HTH domain
VKLASPERLLKNVGRRIAELRAARGLTQEQLAEKLDVGVRYIQATEAGRQNLTLKTVALFAAELRAPVSALFEPPSTRAPRPGRPQRIKAST